ncbi:GL22253 [Drosophila persimilis]|uniref:GL22253 n=1 Tax=Drosophila persimilis TaxID=7234 RepID=B4HD64_DROPE|nr:GL22253 [Drosophila persimilis]
MKITERFVDKNLNDQLDLKDNRLIYESTVQSTILPSAERQYLTIKNLDMLKQQHILYDKDDNLIFYHRKLNSLNPNSLRYNTSQ